MGDTPHIYDDVAPKFTNQFACSDSPGAATVNLKSQNRL